MGTKGFAEMEVEAQGKSWEVGRDEMRMNMGIARDRERGRGCGEIVVVKAVEWMRRGCVECERVQGKEDH